MPKSSKLSPSLRLVSVVSLAVGRSAKGGVDG